MSWHLDAETVAAYRANRVTDAVGASLEAHVVACEECRRLVTTAVDGQRLARNLTAIADAVDRPREHPLERILTALGVRGHIARLLVTTPALRLGWLAALLTVTALAVLATDAGATRGEFVFLVLAPVVPVIGVALSLGPPLDPVHELTIATPISALELLLIRAAAVLATSVPVTLVVSALLPGAEWSAATWLLPALGLTAATLALSRWTSVRVAAGSLSGAWLVAAVFATRGERAAELVHSFPAFRPAGQLCFLVLALVAAASVALTRDSFDLRRVS